MIPTLYVILIAALIGIWASPWPLWAEIGLTLCVLFLIGGIMKFITGIN